MAGARRASSGSRLHLLRLPSLVLNARNDESEAAIVARAGEPGAVTISTNMAGRGTDIMLGGNPEFIVISYGVRMIDSCAFAQSETPGCHGERSSAGLDVRSDLSA